MSDYQKQATDFLKKHNIRFHCRFLKNGFHFEDDKETRDIYTLSLSRDGKKVSFKFGQSINCTEKGEQPTAYDLLTSIIKSDPEGFNNFCGEYGYDRDSRKAEKIYKLVVKEWKKVNGFFSEEELEELQEIN